MPHFWKNELDKGGGDGDGENFFIGKYCKIEIKFLVLKFSQSTRSLLGLLFGPDKKTTPLKTHVTYGMDSFDHGEG